MTSAINKSCINSQKRQRGAVLLVLMTALLAATAYVTLQLTSTNRAKNHQQQEVTRSLAFAKNALLAYAVTYVDNYGHNTRGGVGRLPCPSTSRYGSPARSCGRNSIGFLPGVWSRGGKRIDIDHLERFLHKDLWYSVSADFRYNPAFNALNPDSTENLLNVNNNDEVIAVVLAPGPKLLNQSRVDGVFSVVGYLEGENADGDLVFTANQLSNDRMVTITRSELMPLIESRVLGYVRDWLVEYKVEFGHFPYAAPFNDPLGECQQGLLRGKLPMRQGNCSEAVLDEFVSQFVPNGRPLSQTWFASSSWPDFIYYQVDENCAPDAAADTCHLLSEPVHALQVNNLPTQVLLVSVGAAMATELVPDGQQRAVTENLDMTNYFDTAELVSSYFDYDLRRLDSGVLSGELSNDQYLVIRE